MFGDGASLRMPDINVCKNCNTSIVKRSTASMFSGSAWTHESGLKDRGGCTTAIPCIVVGIE